jgi:hypothetical protein
MSKFLYRWLNYKSVALLYVQWNGEWMNDLMFDPSDYTPIGDA